MDWHKKQLGNESRKFSKEQLEDIIILRYKDKLSYQKLLIYLIKIEKQQNAFLQVYIIKKKLKS